MHAAATATLLPSCVDVLLTLLQKSAASTKKAIAAEYQQVRELLAQEEQNALLAVEHELSSSHVKLKVLTKKFAANVNALSKAKETLQRQLGKPDTLAFLQVRARRLLIRSLDVSE